MDAKKGSPLFQAITQLGTIVTQQAARLSALELLVMALAQERGIPPEKLRKLLDDQADKIHEDLLLRLGDENPKNAALLGIDQLLRRLREQDEGSSGQPE
ncbi:MAG: hypothetical protein K0R17_2258 [Rariglobus sp.]|jgi:hypothetical protein|nr:hypothetical protein [Microvirga sp.]MDF3058043.1 hypothetical protein [Rariglobus sp.]